MLMRLKGCSDEYSWANLLDVKYRRLATQTYDGEEGLSEISWEVVSEDGVAWYGVKDLIEV